MWDILTNLDSAPGAIMGYIAYWIIWIIATVAGLLIAVITYLISVILQLSGNITQLFAVQQGYAITLSLANLGFVLAIIVVAIATILKRESYGIKKTLWRLIVAAILVNFSLVIGGAVLNFANALTSQFLNNLGGDPMAFGDKLAGAFTPQRALINNFTSSSAPPSAGDAAAATLTPILGVMFAAFSIVAIVITLAALLIMLLVRYVYLAILLIIMPFAWLAWTFESTKSNFSKWWSEFFRWAFFAPIVVFFLSLMIATAHSMNGATSGDAAAANPLAALSGTQYAPDPNTNPALAAISKFFGDFVGGLAGSILQSVLLVGLAIGGMMAANKLSIMGSGAAMDTLKSTGDAVKGYAAKQTKKGARWTYQRAGGEKLNQKLQGSRIPLASMFGRRISGITAAGGKDLVKKAATDMRVADLNDDQLILAAHGARGTESTLAVLAEAQKRGKLAKLKEVGSEKDLASYLAKNEQAFKDYDHGKLQNDIDNALMSNNVMRNAAKTIASAGPTTAVADEKGLLGPKDGTVTAGDLLRAASDDFFKDKSKEDAGKSRVGDIFGGAPNFGLSAEALNELSKAITQGIAMKTPTLVNSLANKLDNSAKRDDFMKKYNDGLDELVTIGKMDKKTATDLKNISKKIKKGALMGYSTGAPGTEPTPAAGATPTPPPSPPTH